jgi:hypothetical protein
MSLAMLGRRLERLLLFAGPLTLVCAILLFVAYAAATQQEGEQAKCLEQGAQTLEVSKSRLLSESNLGRYKKLVRDVIWENRLLNNACHLELTMEIDKGLEENPDELIQRLRTESIKLKSSPFKYQGVQLPEKVTLGFMGTVVGIEILLLSIVVQFTVGPMLILWLLSIYSTRYRETILIKEAKNLSEVFPHVINFYPLRENFEPLRRNRLIPYLKYIQFTLYAAFRSLVILIVVGPSVVAFVLSVIYFNDAVFRVPLGLLAVLVSLFALGVITCELLPWHFAKFFPARGLLPDWYRRKQ